MHRLVFLLVILFPVFAWAQASPGRTGNPGRSPWLSKAGGALQTALQFKSYANGSEPASPRTGDVIWSTTDNALRWYTGAAWASAGAAGSTAFTDLTTGTNTVATMTCGTGCSITTSGSGTIAATSLSATLGETSGGTNQTTYTTGDILYASGANTLAKLAAGSDTQVLTLSGGVPTWAAAGGSAAFNDITTGTNVTATMTVGTGASIAVTGTGSVAATESADFAITQAASTSGTPNAPLRLTAGAHTTLAASTEATDFLMALDRTVQFSTGALTTQRAARFTAPTYAFVASSTITDAATLAISGAPVAGTNATITNSKALWVEAGVLHAGGFVGIGPNADAPTVHLYVLRDPTSTITDPLVTLQSQTSGSIDGDSFIRYGTQSANWAMGVDQADSNKFKLEAGVSLTSAADMTIETDGDVGVNTTTPDSKLHVHTNSAGSVSAVAGSIITAENSGAGYISILTPDAQERGVLFGEPASNVAGGIIYNTATVTNGMEFRVNGNNAELFIDAAGQVGIGAAPGSTLDIEETVAASGTPNVLAVVGAAHTNMTADTEVVGVDFDLSATKTWATGTTQATQREALFRAPTYAAAGATTITNAATVAIDAAPTAGSNMTLTNAYALWVQAGNTNLAGNLDVGGIITGDGSGLTNLPGGTTGWTDDGTVLRLDTSTDSVNIGTTGVSDAKFVVLDDAQASGTPATVEVTGAAHTSITASTEAVGINFNMSATKTWATGAIATQREVLIQAPTYAADGASTITDAATLTIDAAPTAGTNVTITNPWALRVDSGNVEVNGAIHLNNHDAAIIYHNDGTPLLGMYDPAPNHSMVFGPSDVDTYTDLGMSESLILGPIGESVVSGVQTIRSIVIATGNDLGAFWDTTSSDDCVAIGNDVKPLDSDCVAVGAQAQAGLRSVGIGFQANAGADVSVAIGYALTPAAGEIFIGGAASPGISKVIFGGGDTFIFTNDTTIGISGETGSNTAGHKVSFHSGAGTGNAAGSAVAIQVGIPTTSGSTLQTNTERLLIDDKTWTLKSIANTENYAATTEVPGADFAMNVTRTWATGAIATQREVVVRAPTYAAAAASTITDAATLAVTAAPVAGTNMTLTNSYALWVQGGASNFDGELWMNGAEMLTTTTGTSDYLVIGTSDFHDDSAGSNNVVIVNNTTGVGADVNDFNVVIGSVVAAGSGVDTSVLIGHGVSGSADRQVAIGQSAFATTDGTAVGWNTTVGLRSVAVGSDAGQSATDSVAVGDTADAANNSVALGSQAKATQASSIALGYLATVTAVNEMVVASASSPLFESYWGEGKTSSSASWHSFRGTGNAGGSNQLGGDLRFFGGLGSGTGDPGNLQFYVSPAIASGSTSQTATEILTIEPEIITIRSLANTNDYGATTEQRGIYFDASVTKSWAGSGTVAEQSEFYFDAPTYTASAASQVMTIASTVSISGAPIDGGANIEFTDSYAFFVKGGASRFDDRILGAKAGDVASATNITLGAGNYMDITGTTTIACIVGTGWTAGSTVTLQFDSTPTVNHNDGGCSGANEAVLLSGAANFSATADDTLTLVYDGATWREVARTVI